MEARVCFWDGDACFRAARGGDGGEVVCVSGGGDSHARGVVRKEARLRRRVERVVAHHRKVDGDGVPRPAAAVVGPDLVGLLRRPVAAAVVEAAARADVAALARVDLRRRCDERRK